MKVEPIQELLVDELRDILHAEKQLLKALPKMAKAARSTQLQSLMETHLAGDRGAGRAAERKPAAFWARPRAPSLAKEWRAWSRKARRS